MKAKFMIGLGLVFGLVGLSEADTIFNGGNLGATGDWSNGKPGPGNPGTVDVDGTVGDFNQAGSICTGGTITFGSGATISGGVDFLASGGNQFIFNNTIVNLTDDFFSHDSSFILNAGSSVNAGDDFQAQFNGGSITINGGSHTAGDLFGTQTGTSTLSFLGGTVDAGRFQFNNGFTIGGGAVGFATGTTTQGDVDGTVNVLSSWTGSLTADSFTGTTWKDAALAGNWTLDGAEVDATVFDANFKITNGGQTLSIPEPATLGILGFGALITLLARRLRV